MYKVALFELLVDLSLPSLEKGSHIFNPDLTKSSKAAVMDVKFKPKPSIPYASTFLPVGAKYKIQLPLCSSTLSQLPNIVIPLGKV